MKKSVWILLCLLVPNMVHAAPTRFWELENYQSFFGGKSEGALLVSNGGLLPGLRATKLESGEKLPGLFSTVLQLKSGKVVIGAAAGASLWTTDGGKLKLLAGFKDEIMVTRIVELPGGDMLVATIPNGSVYRVKQDGKSELFVKLPTSHVWSLQLDGNTLYAGTGPKAVVYRVNVATKKAEAWWSCGESHIMAMQWVPKRGLVVGTTPEARVYELSGAAKPVARLLYDFPGNEIRDLAVIGDTVYAAVNQLQYQPRNPHPTVPLQPDAQSKDKSPKAPITAMERKNLPPLQVVSGTGTLFAVGPRGEMEKVLDIAKGYFTQLQSEGTRIYGSDGHSGRIYRVETKSFSASIVVEVDERQVLGFTLKNEKEGFVVSGDGAGAYELSRDRGKAVTYETQVLDATVPSSFGMLYLYATDANIKLETRSGTIAKPDDKLWSAWKPVTRGTRMPDGATRMTVSTDPARFFQLRITWNDGASTRVERIRIFYSPLNLPPRMADIRVGTTRSGLGPHTDPAIPESPPVRSGDVPITWQVVNNDGDQLEYQLWVRRIGEKSWRSLTPRGPIVGTSFTWKAGSFADGLYEVKVQVSDAPSNSPDKALTSEMISKPYLVDNTPPAIRQLQIKGLKVTFAAVDSASRIMAAQVRVNDEPWRMILPVDHIMDSLTEQFDFSLSPELPRGTHILQVRVADEAGNIQVVSQEFSR